MLLIDTNVAIFQRDGVLEVVEALQQRRESLAVSLLTVIELEGGLYAYRQRAAERRAATDVLLEDLLVLELDRDIIAAYGQIVAARSFSRARVIDRLIAATAIVHGLTLVTINGPNFRDIPGLALEIWPAPGQ